MENQFLCSLHERLRRGDQKELASQLATTKGKTEVRAEIEVATESSVTDVKSGDAAA